MNKAQEKYTQDFREKYYGHNITSKILHMFISGFTEIDATPDTKKYVVRLAGGINKPDQTVNGIQYKTKEEAIKERDRLESCNWVKREPKKPEYMTLDKRSGSWVVCKGKVFYGQFKAKEAAIKRRDELIANGWKKHPH